MPPRYIFTIQARSVTGTMDMQSHDVLMANSLLELMQQLMVLLLALHKRELQDELL